MTGSNEDVTKAKQTLNRIRISHKVSMAIARGGSVSTHRPIFIKNKTFKPDEKEILFLASLAPSGYNTQPWFVQYLEPYHWIIGNDKNKWLPAVDPTQRETMLSIGAFLQNLDYAASAFGYVCDWNLLAATNQDDSDIGRILNAATAKSSDRYQRKYSIYLASWLCERLPAARITPPPR